MPDLRIDFTSGAVAHRLKFGGGRGQDLPKAVGLKKGNTPDIIDATAGLGRDAFLLASLGANVTLIERSKQMHALLDSALKHALMDGETSEIAAPLSVCRQSMTRMVMVMMKSW